MLSRHLLIVYSRMISGVPVFSFLANLGDLHQKQFRYLGEESAAQPPSLKTSFLPTLKSVDEKHG